ncbi:condensation domain-containing protein [Streptomyces sp. M19]
MFFLDRFAQGSAAYQVPVVSVRIQGPLDTAALRAALAALVERHEALRTTFSLREDLTQVVAGRGALPVESADLREVPAADRGAHADRWAAALLARPMDVENGPLAVAGLARLGADDHVLVLVVHHLLVDGWSVGVLRAELAELYAATLESRSPELAPLPLQYADYAVWQRQELESGATAEALRWWTGHLGDRPPRLDLPIADRRPPRAGQAGGRYDHVLPAPVAERVGTLARSLGATPYQVLLACYALLLHRYSGRTDVLVGTPVAGRDDPDLEHLVGLFSDIVVIRTDLAGPLTVRELVRRVRDSALDSLAHQDVPFEQIVAELRWPRDSSANPVFQVLFALHNEPLTGLTLPGAATSPFPIDQPTARFDLSLDVSPAEDGWVCGWEYRADLFDEARVRQLALHWSRLVDLVTQDPDAPVADLPLLRPEEGRARSPRAPAGGSRRRGPGGVRPVGGGPSGPDRGQRRGRPPELRATRPARGRRGRRAERARRAGRRARRVCLPRTPDAVAVMLGVLKAGRPYLPLDPAHPAARVAGLLRDAGAAALVTTGALPMPPSPNCAATAGRRSPYC